MDACPFYVAFVGLPEVLLLSLRLGGGPYAGSKSSVGLSGQGGCFSRVRHQGGGEAGRTAASACQRCTTEWAHQWMPCSSHAEDHRRNSLPSIGPQVTVTGDAR